MSSNIAVSKSLIRTTRPSSLTKENDSNFCLGLLGWCPCSECNDFAMSSGSVEKVVQPKCVKTAKSVKVSDEDRFLFDIDEEELQKMKDGTCPANTLKNNGWAMHTFETWRTQRNK